MMIWIMMVIVHEDEEPFRIREGRDSRRLNLLPEILAVRDVEKKQW